MKKLYFFTLTVSIIVLLIVNHSIATVYHVSKDNGDFKTLHEAIEKVDSGDIIKIHGGVYHESITITKDNITIEAFDPKDPPIFDGSDQEFINTNHEWNFESDGVYSTPYTWIKSIPELNHYGGGKNDYSTLVVYENDIYLKGYKGIQIDGTGIAPYDNLEELNPVNDPPLPNWAIDIKKSISIEGRFIYKNNKLYIRSVDGDHPSTHKYSIPILFHLFDIREKKVVIKNLVIKNYSGYAVRLENSDYSIIENCIFINNHYSVEIRNSQNVKLLKNFIKQYGFWERMWYYDAKGTVFWSHAIDVDGGGKSKNCEIAQNVISGYYSALLAHGTDMNVHDNIFSYCISTHINCTAYNIDIPFNIRIYNNIFHHVDDNSIGVSNLPDGPIWIFRNIFYVVHGLNKAGSNDLSKSGGECYFYNNTITNATRIPIHPYSYPSYKKLHYRNNIFHLNSNKSTFFWRYRYRNSYIEGWDIIPFKNGPDSDYNLFFKDGNTDLIAEFRDSYGSIYTYNKDEFNIMCDQTGLDPNSLYADPNFLNGSLFINADVSRMRLDNISTMNYEEIIHTGYNELYLSHFNPLYNLFALTEGSPAIDRGEDLPDNWPDIVEITDQLIDIGAHEHKSTTNLLSPPNNLRIYIK